MTFKHIKYREDARAALFQGLDKLARCTAPTMGPSGHFVMIEKPDLTPTCTSDGVTVNKELRLPDRFEDMAVRLFKEAANNTNEISGDGTTAATLLVHSLTQESIKAVAEGHDLLEVKKGMEDAAKTVLESLASLSIPVRTSKEIYGVARIASDNDEIARIITEALEEVGRDGVVSVEEGKSVELTLENVYGLDFESGFTSPEFVNDPENDACVFREPLILLYDGVLDNPHAAANFLSVGIEENRPVVFICHDISKDVMATMILNSDPTRTATPVKSCAVKAPLYRDKRTAIMEDIAAATGAEVCIPARGDKIQFWGPENLGSCDQIDIRRRRTKISEGYGSDEQILKRVAEIRGELERTPSEYDADRISKRLAALCEGVTVIKVGAYTETEMRERKRKIEDALASTRSSIKEGIVPGGGAALLWAQQNIKVNTPGSYGRGMRIVAEACKRPFRTILQNTGLEPNPIMFRLLESGTPNQAYNVLTKGVVDAFDTGLTDPHMVIRTSFEMAMSLALVMLQTEVAISPDSWIDEEAVEL